MKITCKFSPTGRSLTTGIPSSVRCSWTGRGSVILISVYTIYPRARESNTKTKKISNLCNNGTQNTMAFNFIHALLKFKKFYEQHNSAIIMISTLVFLKAWHSVPGPHWLYADPDSALIMNCQDLAFLVRRNYILFIKTSLYICELSWLLITSVGIYCVWYITRPLLVQTFILEVTVQQYRTSNND
jgi:hypothetical protein